MGWLGDVIFYVFLVVGCCLLKFDWIDVLFGVYVFDVIMLIMFDIWVVVYGSV